MQSIELFVQHLLRLIVLHSKVEPSSDALFSLTRVFAATATLTEESLYESDLPHLAVVVAEGDPVEEAVPHCLIIVLRWIATTVLIGVGGRALGEKPFDQRFLVSESLVACDKKHIDVSNYPRKPPKVPKACTRFSAA
jgi:hypothetical protein